MPGDVRLKRLELKVANGHHGISAVKVTLTDGFESEEIKRNGICCRFEQMLNFDVSIEIKKELAIMTMPGE